MPDKLNGSQICIVGRAWTRFDNVGSPRRGGIVEFPVTMPCFAHWLAHRVFVSILERSAPLCAMAPKAKKLVES